MVTGKMANDALTNLLSDSLAEMGVSDNSKRSAPMRKASSGPVPSSSTSQGLSPTERSVPLAFGKSQSQTVNPVTSPYGSFDPLDDFFPGSSAGSHKATSHLGKPPLGMAMNVNVNANLNPAAKLSAASSVDDIFGMGSLGSSGPSTPTAVTAEVQGDPFNLGSIATGATQGLGVGMSESPTMAATGGAFDLDALNLSPSSPAAGAVAEDRFDTVKDNSSVNLLGMDDLVGSSANPYTADVVGEDFVVLDKEAALNDSAEAEDGGEPSAGDRGTAEDEVAVPASPKHQEVDRLEDFLGMGGAGSFQEAKDPNGAESLEAVMGGLSAPGAEPSVQSPEEDLLGMFSAPAESNDQAAAEPQQAEDKGFTSLEDLMGATGGAPPQEATRGTDAANSQGGPQVIDDIFGTTHQPSVCTTGGIDFGMGLGGPSSAASSAAPTFREEEIDPNEPELRKELRMKRLAKVQMRMAQALEEARERETIEAMEKAERSELAQYMGPKLDAWSKGKSDNIRALLSTLQHVLWEDSGWKEVSMMDLMNPAQVKKQYRKAMIIMHPDKVKQKGGTTEQIYVADYLFDLTNQAWSAFMSSEM
ncbi:auxilin-related protein [Chloropicon primus]|uniref:J domain-containing protein n=1 Tax=Chloropicon primus TaxID=1764295 RepID=A0A5B8MRT2_9CHLO|nr:hypothetical protein A3770_07p46380 [Chloropicon primus]UPR01338.1 auxilin-related protein [Chloropicon primus]|eukprot:QDZ22120.1 hypothetical protein A3770_07p46380 [Chloropicon primus]